MTAQGCEYILAELEKDMESGQGMQEKNEGE
jgi:hypothetical protein